MAVFRYGFLVLALLMAAPAFAANRVALVIGNSDYQHASKLPNPANDSADMAKAFERLGFEVTRLNDVDYSQMRRALLTFSDKANGADIAVVFYAGHGMEVNKQNYLIPTDAELRTDTSVSFEAIPMELVTEAVSGAKGLKLVVLDACRNNPFAASMKMTNSSRSIGRGFARIEPSSGTLVAFAAKEGTEADDGNGRNSPFTKALLSHIEEPGLEINFLFRRVRDDVMAETGNRQQPFTYGSLPGEEIYLSAPTAKSVATGNGARSQTSAGLQSVETLELALWNEVRDSHSVELLQQFLTRFPNGIFSAVARARLAEAEKGQTIARLEQPASRDGAGQQLQSSASREITQCDILASHPADPNRLAEGQSSADLARNVDEAIAACEAALVKHPGDMILSALLGRSLVIADKYVLAKKVLMAPAQAGNALAQASLGNAYEYDEVGGVDLKEASTWYRRSAEQGFVTSQYNMGVAYEYGTGVEKDMREAARWYRLAADQGDNDARFNLAILFYNGDGVEKDLAQAARYYRLAAEAGHPDAQINMGYITERGEGVGKDPAEAAQWYLKAAEQGKAIAQYNIARAYYYGTGITKDAKQAAFWYRKAADQGDTDAQYGLAYLYSEGDGVARDDLAAAKLIAQSLKGGSAYTLKEMSTNSAAWSRKFRVELQRILREEGVYSGKLDGAFGASTISAMQKYAG